MSRPTSTIIVINRHRVAANKKHGTDEPVIRVSRGRHGKPSYARELELEGPSRIVYDPAKPLPCGARVWIETGSRVWGDEGELG
jgi:hypothetical protein